MSTKLFNIILLTGIVVSANIPQADAYWIWTPKSKKWINPRYSAKDNPEEQFEWAQNFYKEGNFKRALKEFRKIVQEYPKSSYAPEALFFSGNCFMKLRKYYDAYLEFQKILEKYPGSSRVQDVVKKQVQIANHYFYREDLKILGSKIPRTYEYPIEIYSQIVKNSPYGKYADYAQFYFAESYRLANKFDEAIEAYETLVNRFPQSEYVPESRYKIALSSTVSSSTEVAYTEREREKAISEFEAYMQKNDQMPRVNIARQEMEKLKKKNAEKILGIARLYEKRRKYKAALMYYKDFYRKYADHEKGGMVKNKIDELSQKIDS